MGKTRLEAFNVLQPMIPHWAQPEVELLQTRLQLYKKQHNMSPWAIYKAWRIFGRNEMGSPWATMLPSRVERFIAWLDGEPRENEFEEELCG